ncbi:lanthionine synthetase C family protein [Kitasatospora sp. NPDC058965]|uniref:lanthionine synthetase C family protein n=1 Tax=Kitasatospora sp. NPDC058965 TaxID=3346682 RepID=UPI0036C99336
MTAPTALQLRAAEIAEALATRLADPAGVARICAAEIDRPAAGVDRPWASTSLADGYPGIALLFGELAVHDSSYRAVLRGHVSAAVGELAVTAPPPTEGLHSGLLGVGLCARSARSATGDFQNLVRSLDGHIVAGVLAKASAEVARCDQGIAGTTFGAYDVIGGLAGASRYLVGAGDDPRCAEAAEAALEALVRITEPVPHDGTVVPGWWVHHPATASEVAAGQAGSHLNLGLAHGAAGILAALCLAQQHGFEVAGQRTAVERLADWLVGWRAAGADGAQWPNTVSLAEELDGSSRSLARPDRRAWCYGTPGIARALQLAGTATGRADLTELAVSALVAAVPLHLTRHLSGDASLCHGLAGLLVICEEMRQSRPDPRLSALSTALAEALVDDFRPESAFGYTYDAAPQEVAANRPGLLMGTAGVALSLLRFATGARAGAWPQALLLC